MIRKALFAFYLLCCTLLSSQTVGAHAVLRPISATVMTLKDNSERLLLRDPYRSWPFAPVEEKAKTPNSLESALTPHH